MMLEIVDRNVFKIMTLLSNLALVAPNGTWHVIHCIPQTNIYSIRGVIIHSINSFRCEMMSVFFTLHVYST